ncbi:threonine/serine ThrE exporter family protein [Leifsonia sp. Leaf336]|uniref:threonine/serine ThrE exporter family protein n=1 Tax=Leifsonia sp. Leaf336 TaxID=1736341 RepID=UPI0009E9C076|nr:threonine/serine exporter family protein [Leifsonia sp. Leaf336]
MRAPRPRLHLPRFTLRRRSTEVEQLVESPSAQLQEFLVRLGSALLAIGTASRDIQGTLKRVATALGSPRATLIVFPTLIFVGLPGEAQTRFDVAEASGGEVRFDRAAHVYAVVDRALAGTITAVEGIEALQAIADARPRFNRLVRIIGHGFASAGVALVLLGAETTSMLYAFALGMLVGAAKLFVRPGTYAAILLPVATAFALSLIVFLLGRTVLIDEPLQVLVPPLVTLLPGAVLTTGIQELAAGDMVAGSSRLVSGIAQLGFLAIGILAAMTITGVPASTALLSTQPPLGAFQPWLGVLLFSVGIFLYYCGPRRSLYFLTLVLLVAYGGQLVGALIMGNVFSGFFGAFALTVLAYLVQSVRGAPPAVVCFLPAFWLLVPGATGLIRLTQTATGVDFDAGSIPNVLGSIVSIALGVLVGTALYRQLYTIAPSRWGLRLV